MIKKRKNLIFKGKEKRYCIILNNNYEEAQAYCYSLGYRWMGNGFRLYSHTEQYLLIYPKRIGGHSSMTYSDRAAEDYVEFFTADQSYITIFVTLEQLKNILGE